MEIMTIRNIFNNNKRPSQTQYFEILIDMKFQKDLYIYEVSQYNTKSIFNNVGFQFRNIENLVYVKDHQKSLTVYKYLSIFDQ